MYALRWFRSKLLDHNTLNIGYIRRKIARKVFLLVSLLCRYLSIIYRILSIDCNLQSLKYVNNRLHNREKSKVLGGLCI